MLFRSSKWLYNISLPQYCTLNCTSFHTGLWLIRWPWGRLFSSYFSFVSITASVLYNLSNWQHHYGNKNRSPFYFHVMWLIFYTEQESAFKKAAYFSMICYYKLIQNPEFSVSSFAYTSQVCMTVMLLWLTAGNKKVWLVQTGWYKEGMWHAYMGNKILTGYCWENWRKRYNMEDVCTDGTLMLKWTSREKGWEGVDSMELTFMQSFGKINQLN